MKFKKLHPWNLNPQQAISLQNKLRKNLRFRKFQGYANLIAGADVSFKENKAIAAVVVCSYPDFKIMERLRSIDKISYPYIPGLLTFREGPVLEKCFKALKHEPDIIIFDGQGIAHPRNMGIATHMGILLDKPTIGCAKTRLYGEYKEPPRNRGAFSYLFNKERRIGAVLRTRTDVKPVFVSPGYKMDIENCIKLILMCTGKYRIPQPLRLAHQFANLQ